MCISMNIFFVQNDYVCYTYDERQFPLDKHYLCLKTSLVAERFTKSDLRNLNTKCLTKLLNTEVRFGFST